MTPGPRQRADLQWSDRAHPHRDLCLCRAPLAVLPTEPPSTAWVRLLTSEPAGGGRRGVARLRACRPPCRVLAPRADRDAVITNYM